MRKIIVFTNLTLDGVMQAPARPEEDTRDGFSYGGWGAPYAAMAYANSSSMSNIGAYLFGRLTYENFYSVWPKRPESPYSQMLTNGQKYVVSTTLKEPLPWANSTLVNGDVPAALRELKSQPGKDFLVMGSGVLVQTLMQHHLVDYFVLLIHPLLLGSGRHLYPEGSLTTSLKLLEVKQTPNGVAILTYQPTNAPPG